MTQKLVVFPKRAIAALLLALPTFTLALHAQDAGVSSMVRPGATKSIWTRVPTPNIGPANLLESLSADSEEDIWAVGDFVSLNFNGTTWTAIPLAVPQGESTMTGVTALTPANVWAVGSSVVNNTHLISLIEHFDGKQWTIVPSPQFSTGSQLTKVMAFSASDIFAVGDQNSDKQQGLPLVEHYDGAAWTVVATPKLAKGQTAVLNAIGGLSGTDFWVAGSGTQPGTSGLPLVMHFDGHQFTQVPFPGTSVSLTGITEIGVDDAWIVGSTGSTLAAHWDGNLWTVLPTPGQGIFSELNQVSAVSTSDVWASGEFLNSKDLGFNLVEHWDGSSWKISPIPSAKIGFNTLPAALAFPSGSVYMAGTRLHCADTICAGFDSVVFHTTQGK